jgi:hypothetical protein
MCLDHLTTFDEKMRALDRGVVGSYAPPALMCTHMAEGLTPAIAEQPN